MNRFLALAVFAVVLLGCRGPGGPVERAGRGVDNAVYDVGTDIKRAGQKIQRAAE
jgi:predicted small secreted protein